MKHWKILKCGLITLFLFPLYQVSAQWEQIPALSGVPITCMVTINDSTLLVGGHFATLLRSTDHGATWESVWGNGIVGDTIIGLGGGNGYFFAVVNAHVSTYRSSDGGVNWQASSNGLVGIPRRFVYVDTVLFCGTFAGIFRSTDHGDNWAADTTGLGYDPENPGYSNAVAGLLHINSMLYAIKDFGGGIYASRADTVRWYPIGFVGQPNASFAAIDTMIFVAKDDGVYLYSGQDSVWTKRSTGLPDALWYPNLSSADSALILKTEVPTAIYISKDLGLHWEPLASSQLGSNIIAMAATKTHVVARTGTGGWRREVETIVLSAEGIKSGSPYDFHFVQNYPNPFNGIANFGFSIAQWADVKLGVYDILGREVAVLLNERKGPGSYTVQWNSGRAPSGVYFVRMEAGSVVRIVRAVLVK